jgi:hypothetical protein
LPSHLSRLGEAYRVKRAEAHLALAAILAAGPAGFRAGGRKTEDPRFVKLSFFAAAHLEPETSTIAQQSSFAVGLGSRVPDFR